MGRSILLGIREQLQYIDRKAAGICVKCGLEPSDDGKVECRNCGEESNKRSKARYAKRVREADGELCSSCLRNKPTPGLKSCASCRILSAAKYRKQREKAEVAK